MDRLHVRRLGLPDRRARGDDPARGALRRLPDRARDPHRQARRRPRDRAAVRRRARQLRADAEPPRLLARAAAAELPLARPRRRPEGARRRQDQRHLRRLRHRRVASRRSRTSTGSTGRSRSLQEIDEGLVFVNLVETDMLWGHRNDPENFHRCLQDFDRRLPDLLEALRAGRPAGPHLRPRLRPDDAVDRPLARVRAAARLRGRAATPTARRTRASSPTSARRCNAWLGGKAPSRGIPGTPILDAVTASDPPRGADRAQAGRRGAPRRRDLAS